MADQAMRMPARLAAPVHLLQQTGIHQPDGGDAPKANLDSLISDTISGGGRALDEPTRISMESRFGHDFSGVRVYTDSRAAQSARALNALAYTVSRDVVFAAGQYAPNTRVGQRLLAHELTHVVQQSGGNTASVQRDLIDDIAEKTAKDLNQQIAGNPSPYSHVISVFNDLSSDIEDNVASAFVALQPDSKLEQFAADPQGRVMLDVLYEAMITGHVSSFESLQSERILIAKAKWISTDEYVAQAERIAGLRNAAEDSPEELVVDLGAIEIAHQLNDDVANKRYVDVVTKLRALDDDIQDNVASDFIELQPPVSLEQFAADPDGRTMLDVLYEATITGSVTDFERLQAERILEAKAKRIPPMPPSQYLKQLEEEQQYVLPLRMQKTFRTDYAIFKATLEPNGKIKVVYDDVIHFWSADTFQDDFKNLPPYGVASRGFELNPDQVVWLKLYDEGEKLEPVPAIALIDYANQAKRQSVSVGVTAFETGLFLGFGGLGALSGAGVESLAAEVVAGRASITALRVAKGVLWADRIAMALPVISILVNENREWILKDVPGGRALLTVLDQANKIAEFYGWARMGIDGARYLKSRVNPALGEWRAGKAALTEPLNAEQERVFKEIDNGVELILNEADKGENEAGLAAVKFVEDHPSSFTGKPGERHAKIGDHELVEVREPATGAVHCELHSEPTEVPCPKLTTAPAEERKEPPTVAEPGEEPAPPATQTAEPEQAAGTAKRLEEIKQKRARNDTRLKELAEEISRTKRRLEVANTNAAHAVNNPDRFDPRQREDLRRTAQQNKEAVNNLETEQLELRKRNDALRAEAARLAPKPASWPEAEQALRNEFGGTKMTLSTATATSDLGNRNIDCFTPDRVAREAKFGFQKWSERLQEEIDKDVALKNAQRVSSNEWHFYENPNTGIGPDSRLKAELERAEIKIIRK